MADFKWYPAFEGLGVVFLRGGNVLIHVLSADPLNNRNHRTEQPTHVFFVFPTVLGSHVHRLMDAASQRTPPPATAVTAVVGLMHGLAVHPALHGRAGRAACPGGSHSVQFQALHGTAICSYLGWV